MKHLVRAAIFAAAASSLGTSCHHAGGTTQYPAAPMDTTVTDNYFGTVVKDPYRPLENDTAPQTLEWVKAENALTQQWLANVPYREGIRKRLTELADFRKTGLPSKHKDGKYYWSENDGLQNQSVIYRSDRPGGEKEVFFDPNTLSDDGTVALSGLSFSPDGRYAAYIISRSGSDWNEIFVIDTKTKQQLADHIEWAKFTDAAWQGDGFYYSAYPRPEKGKEYSNANHNHQIYYHRLGTPQSDDTLAYEDRDNPLHFHHAIVDDDQNWMFMIASGQGDGNSLMVRSLRDNSGWRVMEPSQDYDITVVDVIGDTAYLLTNQGAPMNRLMAADLNNPARANWREVVPQGKGVLTSVDMTAGKMILGYEQDASSHLYLYDRDGKNPVEIKLPVLGSAAVSADKDSYEVFYNVSSFVSPSAIYSYDMATGQSTLVDMPEIKGVNLDDYITEQVFYTSADGTRIPMFITYKKGLERNGKNPLYLYGYGGFGASMTPYFSPYRMLWLENGGIYAVANLRGGSEYGEEWHQAGTKLNKLNVFNDFIAAAEYMVGQKWTSPELITIEGGSNGGLLVGATVNMRPDLFKVAIPRVGVMDMMRYHLFTIGWNWAHDYGTSADSKEMADYLLAYSPLHNISNDGTPYPAIMITTADHDDRVVPAHSFKYAAALQAADTGDAPKLIRIDSKAGHGAGKPTSKIIDEYTDIYSFIYPNLGITPQTAK